MIWGFGYHMSRRARVCVQGDNKAARIKHAATCMSLAKLFRSKVLVKVSAQGAAVVVLQLERHGGSSDSAGGCGAGAGGDS
jgi:hypothetical protein